MAAIGFFKSPTTGNAVTWDETGAQTDTGVAHDAYKLPTAQSGPTFGGGAAAPKPVTETTWANGFVKSPGDLEKYGRGAYDLPEYTNGRINTASPEFKSFMATATPEQIKDAGNQWNFNAQQTDRNVASGTAIPNAGVGSLFNNISWMPTDTYAGYAAKYNAGKASQDPTWAWGNGGAAMLSEADWNAQQQRAGQGPTSFGGGSAPPAPAPTTTNGPAPATTAPSNYFISPSTGNMVTWDATGKQTDTGQKPPASGIINNATSATSQTPATTSTGLVNGTASSSTSPANANQGPSQWSVTAPQTVAGQFSNLSANSSPIMQQARTNALQQMNGRGLVNSSMALTAGDQAAYNAILPIAQADAGINADAGKTNNAYDNQFKTASNLQTNTQSNMGLNQQFAKENQAAQVQAQKELAVINSDAAARLAATNNEHAKLLSTNSNAQTLMQQATSAISAIANNDKMDAATKSSNSAQIVQNLNSNLRVLSSVAGLNIPEVVNSYQTTTP